MATRTEVRMDKHLRGRSDFLSIAAAIECYLTQTAFVGSLIPATTASGEFIFQPFGITDRQRFEEELIELLNILKTCKARGDGRLDIISKIPNLRNLGSFTSRLSRGGGFGYGCECDKSRNVYVKKTELHKLPDAKKTEAVFNFLRAYGKTPQKFLRVVNGPTHLPPSPTSIAATATAAATCTAKTATIPVVPSTTDSFGDVNESIKDFVSATLSSPPDSEITAATAMLLLAHAQEEKSLS